MLSSIAFLLFTYSLHVVVPYAYIPGPLLYFCILFLGDFIHYHVFKYHLYDNV